MAAEEPPGHECLAAQRARADAAPVGKERFEILLSTLKKCAPANGKPLVDKFKASGYTVVAGDGPAFDRSFGEDTHAEAVTEVFNAQGDADRIVYGEPASVPGTTDADGVYTVRWDEIDPSRAVTEVFNAQGDAEGIVYGEPIVADPMPVGEDMIPAVVAANEGPVEPADSVSEVFNAQSDADGVIDGAPAAPAGSTDEQGVYTVAWENIAGEVEAATGFTAGSDSASADTIPAEGVVTGDPITEAGFTDADGVHTVTWDEIAP